MLLQNANPLSKSSECTPELNLTPVPLKVAHYKFMFIFLALYEAAELLGQVS